MRSSPSNFGPRNRATFSLAAWVSLRSLRLFILNTRWLGFFIESTLGHRAARPVAASCARGLGSRGVMGSGACSTDSPANRGLHVTARTGTARFFAGDMRQDYLSNSLAKLLATHCWRER